MPHIVPYTHQRQHGVFAQGHLELSPINLTYSMSAFQLQKNNSANTTKRGNVKLFFIIKCMATQWQVWATNPWSLSVKMISNSGKGKTKTFNNHQDQNVKHRVQQGVSVCFIVKLAPGNSSKRGWNHPWHPLLPTHITVIISEFAL